MTETGVYFESIRRISASLNDLYLYGSGVVKFTFQNQHFLEKSYHQTAVNNLCESSS